MLLFSSILFTQDFAVDSGAILQSASHKAPTHSGIPLRHIGAAAVRRIASPSSLRLVRGLVKRENETHRAVRSA